MRQKRAKAYKKLMALYSMTFGFRQPYQVLLDSEMCKEAATHKIDLFKQLASVLQGEVKPMITQCCIHELYLQGKEQQPSVDIAKHCERRKCNHREPIPGDECLSSVIGDTNKHRYVIATLSHPLRVKLRNIPATPIVHINRSVMVLEPPSDATLKKKATAEEKALHASAPELALVGSSKADGPPPHKKRKGPKGPNPLSVKKKSKAELQPRRETPREKVGGSKETQGAEPGFVKAGVKRKQDDIEDRDSAHEEISVTETSGKRVQDSLQMGYGSSKREKKERKNTMSGASI